MEEKVLVAYFSASGVTARAAEAIAAKAVKVGHLNGAYVPLNETDVIKILEMCL